MFKIKFIFLFHYIEIIFTLICESWHSTQQMGEDGVHEETYDYEEPGYLQQNPGMHSKLYFVFAVHFNVFISWRSY